MLRVVTASTMRELLNKANSLKIKKADIASILNDNGQFVLVYEERN